MTQIQDTVGHYEQFHSGILGDKNNNKEDPSTITVLPS